MKVWFIGAGPGDPELLTLKAAKRSAACPVCLYAGALVPAEGVAGAPERALVMDTAPMTLVETHGQILAARDRGEDVARVHSGDPSLYGAIAEQIRLLSVGGVRLSTPATMDCVTAAALKAWVEDGVRPAVRRQGGGVEQLRVVAHYQCRTRNHQPGAPISEHGKGRAIDIAGIGLKDGSEITVLTDWGRGRQGRALRQMWNAACGPFGTVLGPEADRFHRDHFHFDTARNRSRPVCR